LKSLLSLFAILIFFSSCFRTPERNCSDFKTGVFEFVAITDSDTLISIFERYEDYEIDRFQNQVDTSSVRWINDCEMILRNKNPKNNQEKEAIHIKILETDVDGYRFEYGYLSEPIKMRGYAKKLRYLEKS
jgi:hypothetical protein